MAPKQLTIKNNSGQALTETLFLLSITGVFLYFLLRCLLAVIFTVALDATAEDYFYCELANKADCLQRLETRLHENQLRDVKITSERRKQRIILTISATHLVSMTVSREFDYEKFRQKF